MKKYFLAHLSNILSACALHAGRYIRNCYQDKNNKSHYLLDKALSISKNQRINLSRAKIECFLATLSSYREVVKQAKLLLGNFHSHESIRRRVIKEAME